ncbi:MAG TPA: Uma2 family endonuclease [Gemmatimonadales bacterium]|nr:Uma2 family endonuclease [Gemmatimonadales bacterium]
MSPPALMTADELQHVYIPDKRVDLVRGVLVVRELPGFRHGLVTTELLVRLDGHVRTAALGRVLPEVGFKLTRDPDTVRGPDVAFISSGRLPDAEPAGFADFAPDLVVEVVSPGDRPGQVLAKVADWLSAGTRLVWVLDPARRVARVYRDDGTEQILSADGSLDGGDVLPGFSCPLAEIL